MLCAYNGFGFDFRVLIHHWDHFGLRVQKNFILVDPWFDQLVLEGKNVKLDKAFKDIQVNTRIYKHNGFTDVNKLRKLVAVRALNHQSLVIRLEDFKKLIFEGEQTRCIWHTKIVPYCSKASFFNWCCRETMRFHSFQFRSHPYECVRMYHC